MERQLEPIPRVPAPSWQTVLEAYLRTLDSEATQKAYGREVTAAMNEFGSLGEVTAVGLTAHRDSFLKRMQAEAGEPLSPASVARHLAALRSFLKFARLTGQLGIPNEVIQLTLKSPRAEVIRPYQVLTERELGRLLAATRANLRDRMLFAVAAATGLREAETCNLQVGDLLEDDEGDLELHVRQGKGRKDRLVPLDRDTAALVRAYLQTRQIGIGEPRHAKAWLFLSRKGGKLSTGYVRKLAAKYADKARIKKRFSFHSLRHGAGLRWIRQGASVVAVQKIMGHRDLTTTQKYVDHLERKDLKKVVNPEAR